MSSHSSSRPNGPDRPRFDPAHADPPFQQHALPAASLGVAAGEDGPSLESFVFEVSARCSFGVADATDALPILPIGPIERLAPAERSRRRKQRSVRSSSVASEPVASSQLLAPTATTNGGDSGIAERTPTISENRTDATQAARFAARRRRSRRPVAPFWTASLGVHALLLAALAAIGIAAVERPEEIELSIGPPPSEEVLFAQADFETVESAEHVDAIAEELPAEWLDPSEAAFSESSTAAALADDALAAQGALYAGAIEGELDSLFSMNGEGAAEFDAGLGGAPRAKFFGAEIEGRRIVFVLDNSGSMQGGRLETVIAELLRCVDSLHEDQEFYVLFHSDAVYPLFYPDPIDRYLRPTEANRRLLAKWLKTVELCLGDSVEEALAIATMIEPDVVFLLSDGRIQGEKKMRYLLDSRSRNFPIHTFAVGMNSSVAGRRNLQQIADANDGKFSESEIPAEMRELSRREMRPYRSETPGPVWGRHVKPFKKF